MKAIFMNTENSKTDKSHIFRLNLSGKLDLKNCNKNIALANFSIYYMCKTLNLHITIINLKYLLQLGMMNLICLMDHILFLMYRIILNTSLKKMKL